MKTQEVFAGAKWLKVLLFAFSMLGAAAFSGNAMAWEHGGGWGHGGWGHGGWGYGGGWGYRPSYPNYYQYRPVYPRYPVYPSYNYRPYYPNPGYYYPPSSDCVIVYDNYGSFLSCY